MSEPIRWWQLRRKRHCPHVRVRGIYGDEINHTPGYRRNECLDCGRLLDGPVSIAVARAAVDAMSATEVRECVCGREFKVNVKYAKPWTVCPTCMKGGEQ